ncbi:hypothetical protein ACI2LJ_27660 [Streptomyces sp. NPDC088090]|uniref:hypothetical protein n=1 Tax=Streptomyces sp. NPDC088090 TaxID=3365822 RepID=UPI00384F1BFE
MTGLPHHTYMQDIATTLTSWALAPTHWTATTDEDHHLLVAEFHFAAGTSNTRHWPNGVYLTWTHTTGWRLNETPGNTWGTPRSWPLSDSSMTYSDPRQVAADVRARVDHGLDGWEPGPICITGPRYDTEAVATACRAWPTA